MEKPDLIFHIGYPKAGSTWLQTYFFPSLPETNYIGINQLNRTLSHYDKFKKRFIRHKIVWPPYYKYINDICLLNENRFNLKKFKKQLIKDIVKDKVNVISSEAYIRPFSLELTANRLGELLELFNLKIIISIRRQKDIIQSRYFHDINLMKNRGFNYYTLNDCLFTNSMNCFHPACNFGLNECVCNKTGIKAIDMSQFDYLKVVNLYKDIFGFDNIHIFVLEKYIENTEEELNKLSHFITGDNNEDFICKIKDISAKNKQKESFKEELIKFNSINWNDSLLYIEDHFRYSNKILSDIYKLDLNSLAYY